MGFYGVSGPCTSSLHLWHVKTDVEKRRIHLIFTFLSSANKCLLKVGAYCAQLEQYQKAIEIYEQVPLPFFLFLNKLAAFSFLHVYNCRGFVSRLEPTRWTILC